MEGLTADEPTIEGDDLGVVTLHAAGHLSGPPAMLQGGLAASGLELAARAVREALEPGSPVPAPTMVQARLYRPTPLDTDILAMVSVGETGFEVATMVADHAEAGDWGDQDRVGGDVLVTGVVELDGHGAAPELDDLVGLALVASLPLPQDFGVAPECWVCGTGNDVGLHLLPGWVDGARVVESWVPDERAAGDQAGFVDPAVMAAVMDCPTVWSARDHLAANDLGGALLSGFTVGWFSRLPLGEEVRIAAMMDSGDGRKIRARCVVAGLDGHVYAAASAFQVGMAQMPGGTVVLPPFSST